MTTGAANLPDVPSSAPGGAALAVGRRRLVTRDEFDRLAQIGFFRPEEKLELIEGEIYEKMTQNSPHAAALSLTQRLLDGILPEGHFIRPQMPLALGERSQPEPDLAVVVGSPRDYESAHPTTAVLVVEISDTTLAQDRAIKAGLYARAGIPEYWIVNLPERVVEVYRGPVPMPGQALDHGYRALTRLFPGETLAPRVAPEAAVPVADVLPRAAAGGA
jgi:Uma2 family endonuclease